MNLSTAKAFNNIDITITKDSSGNVIVNGIAKVTTIDIKSKNGVIHVIGVDIINGEVDTLISLGRFNTLATVLTRADLINTLKGAEPFTIFCTYRCCILKN